MAQINRVVLVMVDGMRPDALMQVDAPVMRGLIDRGVSTMKARTVMPSVTLPCHTSLFYGVEPGRHGITTNHWQPLARPVPSLLDVAHRAGHKTLMYYTWEELRDMGAPGSVDEAYLINYASMPVDQAEQLLFAMAADRLGAADFGLAFLYYGAVDVAGHREGWMSSAYLRQIEQADRALVRVIQALPEDAAVLLLADHGGHEKTHGTDSPEDMTVPLMIAGPGIAAGTRFEEPVTILDVAPTIADWLNVTPPTEWIGRSLMQALPV